MIKIIMLPQDPYPVRVSCHFCHALLEFGADDIKRRYWGEKTYIHCPNCCTHVPVPRLTYKPPRVTRAEF